MDSTGTASVARIIGPYEPTHAWLRSHGDSCLWNPTSQPMHSLGHHANLGNAVWRPLSERRSPTSD